jgi:hypothetical protein
MDPPAPAPPALRDPAVTRLGSLLPAALLVDDPTTPNLRECLPAAVDVAFAQAGPEGVDLLADGLGWIAAMSGGDWILHGTGSWALDGILRDGKVRAGGDGMSREVAITGVVEPDIFVLRWQSPLSLYSAAAFAYMNADWRQDHLLLSAVRLGRPYVGDLLAELAFPQEEGSFLAASPMTRAVLTRHRLPERDAHFREGLAALEELIRRGDTTAATRPLERGLAVSDGDSALTNVLFAIQLQMRKDSPSGSTPEAERFVRAAHRVIELLRPCLLCPEPGDSPARLARKEATARALRAQFPVILVAEAADLDCRVDPSYPWSDERRVPGAMEVRSLTHVLVPSAHVTALERRREQAGLVAAILPLEYFESMRLVAESPARSQRPG